MYASWAPAYLSFQDSKKQKIKLRQRYLANKENIHLRCSQTVHIPKLNSHRHNNRRSQCEVLLYSPLYQSVLHISDFHKQHQAFLEVLRRTEGRYQMNQLCRIETLLRHYQICFAFAYFFIVSIPVVIVFIIVVV